MIFLQLSHQLQALRRLITALTDTQYRLPIRHLGQASIGGHTRHIIELLDCAIQGCHSGSVDYVNRKRNMDLQNHKEIAAHMIDQLELQLELPDRRLWLVVDEPLAIGEPAVETTYYREIVYNTEHAIHHLAMIKVALLEMQLDLVDAQFGMGYSTLKYKVALESAS